MYSLSSVYCILRYAVSVMWELDEDYRVRDVWYGRTVIRSAYKLYYELAQEIHDGADDDHLIENIPELERVIDSELPDKYALLFFLLFLFDELVTWFRGYFYISYPSSLGTYLKHCHTTMSVSKK